MGKIGSFLFSFFFFFPTWANSITVTSEVDREKIGINDTLTLTLNVVSDGSVDFDAPQEVGGDFSVAGYQKSSSTKISIINGVTERKTTKTFYYTLTPQKKGQLILPPLKINVGGKTYKTQSFQIEVVDGSVAPSKRKTSPRFPSPRFGFGGSIFDIFQDPMGGLGASPKRIKGNVFIRVVTNKTKVYLGETLVAKWYLYIDPSFRVSGMDPEKTPQLKNFWKEELSKVQRLSFKDDVFKGKKWKRALLSSFVLSPIKQGRLALDPYISSVSVSSHGSFFGNRLKLKSPEIPITVLPLPHQKPPHFTGGVGDFLVSFQLDSTQVKVNDPVALKITFQGQGNAKLIEFPSLENFKIPDIQVLEGEKTSKFLNQGRSSKTVELILIPEKEGTFEFPKLSFSFFNPTSKKFYEKSIPSFLLKSVGGDAPFHQAKKEEGKEFLLDSRPSIFYFYWWDQVFFGLLFVISVLGYLFYRLQKSYGEKKMSPFATSVRSRLQKMDLLIHRGDWRGFGKEGVNLLYFVLQKSFFLEEKQGGLQNLIENLPPSFKEPNKALLLDIVSELEKLSFAPEPLVQEKKEKKNLRALLKKVESIVKKVTKNRE